ncbi:MAG TPA: hypothetical protein VEY51_13355, partial [Chondromyces sp.]|nr:hypothetical protein [Chondromyces sp.]
PASFKADLEAMYTCLHGAKQQLKTVLGSYGQKTVAASIESMFEYSQKGLSIMSLICLKQK